MIEYGQHGAQAGPEQYRRLHKHGWNTIRVLTTAEGPDFGWVWEIELSVGNSDACMCKLNSSYVAEDGKLRRIA